MRKRIIIEGNTIYEIDDACMRKKKQDAKRTRDDPADRKRRQDGQEKETR